MNVVILQPSYIPWRGYFHQIQRADLFVFYDCVQYDKGGWRNRNRIKTPNGVHWLTIPVHSAGSHHGLKIQDVRISSDSHWRRKHKATITYHYRKAPYWDRYADLIDSIYETDFEYLADFTCATTIQIARALGIESTRFVRSSELKASGSKTARLLDILQKVGAARYFSGPSARAYLETDLLEAAGVSCEFMNYDYPDYPQFHGPFAGAVTVLDLLFHVGPHAPEFIWNKREPTAVASRQSIV
jgi:hypothetical protein